MSTNPQHPYYPTELRLDSYVENDLELWQIFSALIVALLVVWGTTISMAVSRKLKRSDTACAMWFVTCGLLHVFFEGYYTLHYKTLAGENTIFAQMWKE